MPGEQNRFFKNPSKIGKKFVAWPEDSWGLPCGFKMSRLLKIVGGEGSSKKVATVIFRCPDSRVKRNAGSRVAALRAKASKSNSPSPPARCDRPFAIN